MTLIDNQILSTSADGPLSTVMEFIEAQPGIVVVLALVIVVAVLRRLKPARRRQTRSKQSFPNVGEYWMAWVPFRDGTGGKDRPCLVVRFEAGEARVLYVTSQDRSSDNRYVRVDTEAWHGSNGRAGWMQTSENRGADPTLPVPLSGLRRYLGRVEPFNQWMVDGLSR